MIESVGKGRVDDDWGVLGELTGEGDEGEAGAKRD